MSHSAFPLLATRLCILLLTFIPFGHVAWFCYKFPLAQRFASMNNTLLKSWAKLWLQRRKTEKERERESMFGYVPTTTSCWTHLSFFFSRTDFANYIQWIGFTHICSVFIEWTDTMANIYTHKVYLNLATAMKINCGNVSLLLCHESTMHHR